ncbi:MAG: sulfotransferase [Bacteroidetes bacterium]|nr:sulfotransferase [Bacteroidota bacterium]
MVNSHQIEKFNRQAPIIIIGAGRSGSTMLSAIFNAHPDICFFGETYFLAPFVWNSVFEKYGLIMSYLNAWRNPLKKTKDEMEALEKKRIGKLIAQFVADVTKTDPDIPCWGFKEIWNGSPQFETFNWSIYDSIFPNAKYVHLVRNPIRYAISTAGRDQEKFTRQLFDKQLLNWVKIHDYNSTRANTKRYQLVRYEDILDSPNEVIRRILEFLDVEWNPECLEPMNQSYVPSLRDPLESNKEISNKPIKLKGLYQHVEDFEYVDDIASMGFKLKDDRKRIFLPWS